MVSLKMCMHSESIKFIPPIMLSDYFWTVVEVRCSLESRSIPTKHVVTVHHTRMHPYLTDRMEGLH